MNTARHSSILLLKVLLGLCVALFGFFLANLGCSSGAVCYRQTDCPTGTSCHNGQCVRDVALGDAGSTSEDVDAGTAGGVSTAVDGAGTGGAATTSTGGAATAGTGGS